MTLREDSSIKQHTAIHGGLLFSSNLRKVVMVSSLTNTKTDKCHAEESLMSLWSSNQKHRLPLGSIAHQSTMLQQGSVGVVCCQVSSGHGENDGWVMHDALFAICLTPKDRETPINSVTLPQVPTCSKRIIRSKDKKTHLTTRQHKF